jgi:hypothetical protein
MKLQDVLTEDTNATNMLHVMKLRVHSSVPVMLGIQEMELVVKVSLQLKML